MFNVSHNLKNGQSKCGFPMGNPKHWQKGHTYIPEGSKEEATCYNCNQNPENKARTIEHLREENGYSAG